MLENASNKKKGDMTLSSENNFFNKNESSKSHTLKFLSRQIKYSKIEKIYDFTVSEWADNHQNIIKKIQRKFGSCKIIIRSSAIGEDSIEKSHAGNYKSVLNVDATSESQIKNAVKKVISSYTKKGNTNTNNLVLIQTQTKNIQVSGVIFSRIPDSGSPYFIINYEESGSTDRVTKGLVNNSIKIFRKTNLALLPLHWSLLLKSVTEIEQAVNSTSLDIEFGITKTKQIIIFQVRPITSIDQKPILDSEIIKIIKQCKDDFRLNQNRHNSINDHGFFSDMTDWNPAEIIGNNPNLLDYSLYDYLIMNDAWCLGRKKLSYQNLSNKNLMMKFGNKPYVDVRHSFNSLIPKNIPQHLQKKLLHFYHKKLETNQHLHDKVEFEILFSCFEPFIENRLVELKSYNFSDTEIEELKNHLLEFTNEIINNFDNFSKECSNSIKIMKKNRLKILSNLSQNERKYKELLTSAKLLLEDCKKFGTIPFSMMARLAFISSAILKSLIKNEQISNQSAEIFMNSIDSPLSRFQNDQIKFRNNQLSKKQFLSKYGHLRPGTYDINAIRYDQNPLLISDIKIKSKTTRNKHIKFNGMKKLENSGLDFSKINFDDFVKKSLSQREELKFEFTKNLSDALELISEAGTKLNFSRDEISNLDISFILSSYKKYTRDSLRKKWKKAVLKQKNKKLVFNNIVLPPIITSQNDFDIITYPFTKPNFVTKKKISSELVSIKKIINASDMSKKIILLENADPGYDWIFSYNLAGLITKYGGVASHMAIRCAELNLPAAIGCGEIFYEKLQHSSRVLLDCENSQISILEHTESDRFIEEKQILKSLGYIK